jgi:uncharacterized membrane protein
MIPVNLRFLTPIVSRSSLCVSATLGGPPTAVTMAIAKGWPQLVVPAMLVGIWGYVVDTLLGVLVGEVQMRHV